MLSATYSPEDNKLRLYATSRLDPETYAKVKEAGFIWAPKQDLFVAPMWTPNREDLLIELCEEIDDEDTSLVERAEQRAERFENYSESRLAEAQEAEAKVQAISNVVQGQPILIGHHSEKRARRDYERMQEGMHKSVMCWHQSEYWKDRAKGAIKAAKYKELPAVRARRIKGLEADQRKFMRDKLHQCDRLTLWSKPMTLEQAQKLAGYSNTTDMDTYFALDKGEITAEQASQIVLAQASASISRCDRWLCHIAHRLEYERAMLAESGGTVADRTKPEKGGACRCWCDRGAWIEIQKINKVSVTVLDNWGNGGPDFTRTIPFDQLKAIMSKADFDAYKAQLKTA